MITCKKVFITSLMAISLISCNHKDLDYETLPQPEIDVVFDWRKAPDADPESMVFVLYSTEGQEPMRFVFPDRFGGHIAVPPGHYTAVCVNGDINDWACMRNTHDPETTEIFTPDATELAAYGLRASALPGSREDSDERIAAAPGMVWNDRLDDIFIQQTSKNQTVTLYPAEGVCHYTVDIVDIENLQYLHGTSIDATLSGLAEGYLHGKSQATDTHISMPVTLSETATGNSLHGEFLNFGVSPSASYRHILTVYLYLTDGTKWYYSFDVSDQVDNAPDPRHVNILVSGLTLPKPLSTGGGFIPDVNDWNTEIREIKM